MYKITGVLLAALLVTASVKPVNMKQLQDATLNKTNDTLYVVNFWATWCKPCVNEMPYFVKAQDGFGGKKVKVVFVSMNSVRELAAVQQFVSAKQIKEDVLLLNAGNPNNWIDTVDVSWSGAIPATVMYRNGKKVYFREGEFTQNELDSIIQTKIN
ncbi:MAG TPA: TlpA disulfide reductase family protein [Chitinophagales bacterium]|nr:TlpA disulfide reductase family protein [Chitinophagales bacterium]